MNRNKKKTKGIPKKLLALMLCCFCLVTAMPISAATPEPEATPAVETVVEQPTPSAESIPTAEATPTAETTPTAEPSATAEPSPSAESTPTAEPTPSAEATATAEPSAEPTTEPETASPSPSASPSATPAQSAANALNEAQAKATNREVTIEQGGSVEVGIDWMRTSDFRVISSDHQGITAETYGDRLGGADGYRISVSDDVPRGDYELKVHYQTLGWLGNISHDETITVHVEPAPASIYYLKSPGSIPSSNEPDEWSADPIGTGTVDTAGATWSDARWQDVNGDWQFAAAKNVLNPADYIRDMPGMTKETLEGETAWKLNPNYYGDKYYNIIDQWIVELESELDVDLETNDISAVYLVPYKISRNNDTDPDKHIDCEVRLITDKVFYAEFKVIMPDGSTEWPEGRNIPYKKGDSVKKTTLAPTEGENSKFPQTKVVDGVTYEFVGWYNEAGELLTEDNWDYSPSPDELEDNIVTFTAKYVPKTYDLTVTKNLSGNMYNANDEFTFTVSYGDETEEITLGDDDSQEFSIPNGATVTITETDSKDYDFSVDSTSSTGLDDEKVTVGDNSVSFTMPANDVKIVIDNKKDVDIDTGVFLDTLPYILILGVAAAGAVVLVKRRKHSDD